jgi:HNH endonuclease
MLDLRKLSDSELLSQTKSAVSDERNQTFKILHYLREVERRSLFLEKSHSSMFVFCMKELGYDEHQTQRRLSAMRLLREIPEIEPKIASGELSLTALNKAKAAFNKMNASRENMAKSIAKTSLGHDSSGHNSLSQSSPNQSLTSQNSTIRKFLEKDEKLSILKTLENKSIKECEKELIKVCPQALPKKPETQRLLTEDLVELKLIVKKESIEKLARLKDFHSHKNMTTAELLDYLIDLGLSESNPALGTRRKNQASERSKEGSNTRNRENSMGMSGERVKQVGKMGEKVEDEVTSTDRALLPSAAQVRKETSEAQIDRAQTKRVRTEEARLETDRIEGARTAKDCEETIAEKKSEEKRSGEKSGNGIEKKCQGEAKSRYIPKPLRRGVWQRDQGRCQFTDPTTQKQCGSTFQIQIEHIKPFSLGGKHELDNLTLYCRAHNIHQAVKIFGANKMAQFGIG